MSSEQARRDGGWYDLRKALSFTQECFSAWHRKGKVPEGQMRDLAAFFKLQRENWGKAAATGQPVPTNLGLPEALAGESPAEQSFRYWHFLDAELRRLEAMGRLTSNQASTFRAEAHERLAALKRRREHEGIADVVPVEPARHRPRRNILEILLDPRSIQWLLALGGVLMVVGLVILLWVNEFFTPPVIALMLGLANLALLFGGWATSRFTRHQHAGRALTLLACLVMPLNLWYYHANALLTMTVTFGWQP